MLKLEVLFFISRLCCQLFSVCANGVCLVDMICRWCFSLVLVLVIRPSLLCFEITEEKSADSVEFILSFFLLLRYIDGSGRGLCHPHSPLV